MDGQMAKPTIPVKIKGQNLNQNAAQHNNLKIQSGRCCPRPHRARRPEFWAHLTTTSKFSVNRAGRNETQFRCSPQIMEDRSRDNGKNVYKISSKPRNSILENESVKNMNRKNSKTTCITGYFNQQKFPIYIEISEINLKAELAPGAYLRDRAGRYINDPIFEAYCHPKGLARAIGDAPVPIYYVPRFIKSERPVAAVTQATGFVRQPDGRTANKVDVENARRPASRLVEKCKPK